MRNGTIVTVVLIAIALAIIAYRSRQAPQDTTPAAMVDDGGERIISIAPSATEALFALGLGDRVVGRTAQCNYPPEVSSIPSIGSGTEPDVERILSARPTVVVGLQSQSGYPVMAALEGAGVEVHLMPDGPLASVLDGITALGERFDRAAEATAIVESINDKRGEISEQIEHEVLPTVAFVVGTDPIYLAGTQTFIDTLILTGGGQNPNYGEWVRYDDEAFIVYAPDIIIHATDDGGGLEAWSRFRDSIPAVAEGRICVIDPDIVARPGPRLPEAMDEVARCIRQHALPRAAVGPL